MENNMHRDTYNIAMNIVNQLFDIAEVPVTKRQSINDKCTDFVHSFFPEEKPLKPLSEVSEADAIEVGKIYKNNVPGGIGRADDTNLLIAGLEIISLLSEGWTNLPCEVNKIIKCYQYLESKGYQMPVYY